jgi:hypothetical protein
MTVFRRLVKKLKGLHLDQLESSADQIGGRKLEALWEDGSVDLAKEGHMDSTAAQKHERYVFALQSGAGSICRFPQS